MCDEPQIRPEEPKKIVEQIVIQTIINQNSSRTKQPHLLFGKKLNAYLNSLDSVTFKQFFPQLPLRAKIMYMLTVTTEEYERFLDRYTNDEWTEFWLHSGQEEQKHLPKTRAEQLTLIRDAYYLHEELHSSMLFSYFNPKSPYPSDLAAFKIKFHKDNSFSSQANNMQSFLAFPKQKFLEAYMLRKRYELFNL